VLGIFVGENGARLILRVTVKVITVSKWLRSHLEWLKVAILAQKYLGNKMFGKD
jgi:hypothetical protein